LRRCSAALDHSVRGDRFPDAEEIRSEILSRFAEGFAVDAAGDPQHRLDFFEIRFNAAFARLRLDVTRSEARRRRHLVPLPEGASAQTDDDPRSLPPKVFSRPANQEEQLRGVELRRAIDALPPDERDVIILSRILGYPIESDDPSKMTVAKHCGVSPRTVRNRLTRALAKLARTLDTGDSP
ncbi:MAG: sigma factor-like helix-turn-helix DNA-binding protein, partial [Acidobacteriota bacterium]